MKISTLRVFALFSCPAWFSAALVPQEAAPATSQTLVQLEKIELHGSRFPAASLVRLSGLQLGSNINDAAVKTACHKITATGLFKSIEYAYDAYPDKPGVVLTLTVIDEQPLVPATIKPPQDEAALWQALSALDPLFVRELPPTEKAVHFYTENLDRCLKAKGSGDEYAEATILGDPKGQPSQIVFQIRRYKGPAIRR